MTDSIDESARVVDSTVGEAEIRENATVHVVHIVQAPEKMSLATGGNSERMLSFTRSPIREEVRRICICSSRARSSTTVKECLDGSGRIGMVGRGPGEQPDPSVEVLVATLVGLGVEGQVLLDGQAALGDGGAHREGKST